MYWPGVYVGAGPLIVGAPVTTPPVVVLVVAATVAGTLVKVPVQNAPSGQQATLPALSSVQIAFLAQHAEPAPGRERKEQDWRFGPHGFVFCRLERSS